MAKKSPIQERSEELARAVRKRSAQSLRPERIAVEPESLREAFAEFPNLDVLDRRLANPEQPGSLPIRLVDEPPEHEDPSGRNRKWYLRWFNTAIPNRFHSATATLGYVPVRWNELRDKGIIANAFAGTDDVRRGDRGVEVLCKMPMAYYRQIKRKQREKEERAIAPKRLADEARQAAVNRGLDPETVEGVGGIVGSIKVHRERLVSSAEEES